MSPQPTLAAAGILPGFPHLLLCPEKNPGWQELNLACQQLRQSLLDQGIRRLVLYSTRWPSVIGHQIQTSPHAEFAHVDEEWHELGSLPYHFAFDTEFGEQMRSHCARRGLHARCVNYKGFPIDTASVVALKLLNPDNAFKVSILSCNVYADRAETIVLGKAVRDALQEKGEPAAALAVSSLSARQHAEKKP